MAMTPAITTTARWVCFLCQLATQFMLSSYRRLQRLPKLVEVLARLAEEGLEGAPQRRLGGGMEPAICLAPVLGEMPITAPKHHERVFSPASAAPRSAAVGSVKRESIHLGGSSS